MPLAYTYPDAYLEVFCTEDRETRAIAEVELLAGDRTFSAEWTEKLVILQTYIIACIENQAALEDLFDVKLKLYREELALQLSRAKEAADEAAEETGPNNIYTFAVERN
jgi:hypothetical protein